MLSTIAFIFVLSILVVVHEFGHFIVAKLMKVRVETFSVGFGKKLISFTRGDTEYCVSAIPLGGYVKMSGDNPEEERQGNSWEFLSKPVGERAAIVAAGPLFNYIFAFIVFSIVFFIGFSVPTAKIGEIVADYPAQTAGVQEGDRIVSIAGENVKTWDELSAIIQQKTQNIPVSFEIERKNILQNVMITPKVIEEKNLFGEDIKIGVIGIRQSSEVTLVRFGVGESVIKGAQQVWMVTHVTYKMLSKVFTGQMSMRKSIAGPIGIFKITGDAAKTGFSSLLQIMALLSVSLAIINLFPIPVLDGGHLVFMFIEKIKGKPVSIKTQEVATRIGFALLLALMVFTVYNDLLRYDFFQKVCGFFTKK
ncbi:MAG: RIP metalloprotease RseP [PVC group bacterium]|nr:RIP metalloprotease RseP [PVC group bacterium]